MGISRVLTQVFHYLMGTHKHKVVFTGTDHVHAATMLAYTRLFHIIPGNKVVLVDHQRFLYK